MNFNATRMAVLLATVAMAGCTTVPAKPEIVYRPGKVVDTACTWTRIITISKDDKLTDETSRQILAHDKAYSERCKK